MVGVLEMMTKDTTALEALLDEGALKQLGRTIVQDLYGTNDETWEDSTPYTMREWWSKAERVAEHIEQALQATVPAEEVADASVRLDALCACGDVLIDHGKTSGCWIDQCGCKQFQPAEQTDGGGA
jgi:hypothetical protein